MERDIAQVLLSSKHDKLLSSLPVTVIPLISKSTLLAWFPYKKSWLHWLSKISVSATKQKSKTGAEHDDSLSVSLQLYISLTSEESVKSSQLDQVAELIDQVDRVYFGIGSSGLVAREMKLRFMRLGVVVKP